MKILLLCILIAVSLTFAQTRNKKLNVEDGLIVSK